MSTVQRFTSADLLTLPHEEGTRYEIINGELYVSTQPHAFHQLVCTQLGFALRRLDQAGVGKVLGAPGVIFSDDNNVAPDVVWVSARCLSAVLGTDGHLHGAPELVVEVLSPGSRNIRRDREGKLDLYSRCGVEEYWIVDWRLQQIEVFRRSADGLVLMATFGAGDTLTSPLFPGGAASVADIFEGTMAL